MQIWLSSEKLPFLKFYKLDFTIEKKEGNLTLININDSVINTLLIFFNAGVSYSEAAR